MVKRKFSNVDEVEFVFGRTLTARQADMIAFYIETGERPSGIGCQWCDETDMRVLTGQMDIFIQDVNEGREKWPWKGTPTRSSE